MAGPQQTVTDEFVYGPKGGGAQTPAPPAVVATQPPQSPQGPVAVPMNDADVYGDWLPSVARYPTEAATSLIQGGTTEPVGQSAQGAAIAMRGADKKALETWDAIDQGWIPQPKRGQTMYDLDPYDYYGRTYEERQQMRRNLQPTMEQPLEERPLFQAGQAIRDVGNKYLGPAPGWEKSHIRTFTGGLGSAGSNIALNAIPYVGPVLAPLSYITQGMSQQYDDAKKFEQEHGVKLSEDQKIRAGQLGSVAGATEFVDTLLPMFGSPGKLAGFIRKFGLKPTMAKWTLGAAPKLAPIVAAGVERATKPSNLAAISEAGQEGIQQWVQNLIAKGLYDPQRDQMEGVLYNALIGGLVGKTISKAANRGADKAHMAAQQEGAGAAPSAEDIAGSGTAEGGPPSGPSGPQDGGGGGGEQLQLPLQPPPKPGTQLDLPLPPVAPPAPRTQTTIPADQQGLVVGGAPTDISSRARVTTQPTVAPQMQPQEPSAVPPPQVEPQPSLPPTSSAAGDQLTLPGVPPPVPGVFTAQTQGTGRIVQLQSLMTTIEQQIPNYQTAIATAQDPVTKAALEQQLKSLQQQYAMYKIELSHTSQLMQPNSPLNNGMLVGPDEDVPPEVRAQVAARSATPLHTGPTLDLTPTSSTIEPQVEPQVQPDEQAASVAAPTPTPDQEIEASKAAPVTLYFARREGNRDYYTFFRGKAAPGAPTINTTRGHIASSFEYHPETSEWSTTDRTLLRNRPGAGISESQYAAHQRTVNANPVVASKHMTQQLKTNLYGKPEDIAPVTIKEMMQNAFDAVKTAMEKRGLVHGNIEINTDPATRTISIKDNGIGMTDKVLGNEFLSPYGTLKENSRPSGGLGIAKMMIIFNNKRIKVVTMRNGEVSELNSTGAHLDRILHTEKEKRVDNNLITVRDPTAADRAMFPEGHGTYVEIEVDKTTPTPGTLEPMEIPFPGPGEIHPVLQNSPLFANIGVTYNGVPMRIGEHFPMDRYSPFRDVKFNWGNVRIYASTDVNEAPNEKTYSSYKDNVHVLANGLLQFSLQLKKPGQHESIPVNFYVDINPSVTPSEPGYPIAQSRQEFAPGVRKDFEQLFNYLTMVYHQATLEKLANDFGEVHYLSFNPSQGKLLASPKEKLEPSQKVTRKIPLIEPEDMQGASMSFHNGNMVVNGQSVPTITPQDMKNYQIDTGSLMIDPKLINRQDVMVHDNQQITVDPLTGPQSLVNYGVQKFGNRFNEYMYLIGKTFHEIRDKLAALGPTQQEVARYNAAKAKYEEETGTSPELKALTSLFPEPIAPKGPYEGMSNWAVGVSMDPTYRGVSITLPFEGMFVNPFMVRYIEDTIASGYYLTTVMVHEAAHFNVRSHDDQAGFPQEFQHLWTQLATNPNVDINSVAQRVIDIVDRYHDIVTHMHGVMTSGVFPVSAVSKRFSGGTLEASNDRGPGSNVGPGQQPGPPVGLSQWSQTSPTVSSGGAGRGHYAFETTRGGEHGDAGLQRNHRAFETAAPGSGASAVPQQPATTILRERAGAAIGNPSATPAIQQQAAHADRMNVVYKYMLGLNQLVLFNQRFLPLLRYAERVREMWAAMSQVNDASLRVLKDWRHLGPRSENLGRLLDDMANMRYRTPQEVKQGVERLPTNAEMAQYVAKHNIDKQTLEVYNKIRLMFNSFLGSVTQESIATAQRTIQDPAALIARVDAIKATQQKLLQVPYFPFVHFGRHYVMARDQAGNVVHFETFEGNLFKNAARKQSKRAAELQAQNPTWRMEASILPEATEPFIGMPPSMLEDIKNDPNIGLTDQQKQGIDMLLYMRTSQGGFASHFKQKSYVPGYSQDFQRAFSRYFFHGSRYYARQKYGWQLQSQLAQAKAVKTNTAAMIADYMQDHIDHVVMDSRGDYGWAKGAIFIYSLGYVPSAATLNLTQTPMVSLPFLSAKFGPHRATASLLNAMRQIDTFYRRGAYDNATPFEYQALGYGIKTGRLTEAQSADLAGMSQTSNLKWGYGGNKLQEGWKFFMEKSAWMFEMMEQTNRRIVYRAALNLALAKPNAKFVQESIHIYNDEYNQLVAGYQTPTGPVKFTPAQAAAIVTAINATDQTQFVYSKYAKPKIMRGPIGGTLLVFKQFAQSMIFTLAKNPGMIPYFLIVAAGMGGLGGLPFYDDIRDMLKSLGRMLFHKDFDLDKEIRNYTTMFSNGKIEPDLVLHGLARRGFGLPSLIDLMGAAPSRGLNIPQPGQNVPFPMFDRSKAVGLGQISPISFGNAFMQGKDMDQRIADELQKASGAILGVGFNMYKFVATAVDDPDSLKDFKSYERVIPRFMANASRAYRTFSEGRERMHGPGPASSPTVVPYDVRDTEQMMEVLGILGGYQPLRQTMKWDYEIAKMDLEKYYDFQQKALMNQWMEAINTHDEKDLASVREATQRFNRELPDWAKGRSISADSLISGLKKRQMDLAKKQIGAPLQKRNALLEQHLQELYPQFGAPGQRTLDVRQVR